MRKVSIHKIVIFSLVLSSCFVLCMLFSGCQGDESSPSALTKSNIDTSPTRSQDIEHNIADNRVGIEIDSMSDCLNMGVVVDTGEVPFNLDCIQWVYSTNKKLHILHANAGFNCCPVIDKTIEVIADTILITEIEVSGDCDCTCLFDLYYTITNLRAAVYHVKVIEPYVGQDDEQLEFTMDLRHHPEDEYCVRRDFYPWGE